ncbi:MAG: PQQ-dependent sugar dehydrogenase, partial [Marinoscillum sp.]
SSNTFSGINRELIRFDYPGKIHGVQEIAFNPTVDPGDADYGNLYICLGDGSSGSKQLHDNLQTTSSFLGTIFRIDPQGNNSSNGQYGIPDDNPFYEGTGTGVVGEIYAYGFRNPHRISWDVAGTHKMLVGDIGEKNIEEINLVEPGHNYGWNKREGTFLYDKSLNRDHVFSLPTDDATYQYTYPVAQYDHDEGIAVVGGYVYRGTMLTSLNGQYVFGDIVNGKLFHVPEGDLLQGSQSTISQLNLLNQSGSPTTLLEEVSHTRVDLRFGVGLNDELYILSKVDGIIRVLESVDYVTATANMKVSKFFPNPGKGTFKVLGEHGQLTIHVYNLSGALVASVDSFNASDDVLDLSHLPSGIYTFHLLQGTTSTVQKVVLE